MGAKDVSCCDCCGVVTDGDHTACAFIADLAAARGLSFKETKAQYEEQNNIDITEAKVLGEEVLEPAPAMPLFAAQDSPAGERKVE